MEIAAPSIEKDLVSHAGKSAEVTMGARLAATLKKGGDENPLVRVKPGVFALREWDDATIRAGLDALRSKKKDGEDDGDEELFGDDAADADDGAAAREPSAAQAPAMAGSAPAA